MAKIDPDTYFVIRNLTTKKSYSLTVSSLKNLIDQYKAAERTDIEPVFFEKGTDRIIATEESLKGYADRVKNRNGVFLDTNPQQKTISFTEWASSLLNFNKPHQD
ncbi:hypothetical protein HA402_014918 [Bradysia odoriphaga]|nr:hypothetical protein HA402_014918 [Bradysia odoriphaga]